MRQKVSPEADRNSTIKVAASLKAVPAAAWDACAQRPVAAETNEDTRNPFVTHAFLSALEESGSAVARTGWSGAHLLVEGKKMSKSLGNFFTLRDLLAKGFNGREIRYLLLSSHYRETFNFTLEGLAGARTALARIDECLGKLRELAGPLSRPSGTLSPFYGERDEVR